MKPLDRIIERARAAPRRIVFPEATESRTLQAVKRLAEERIVEPLLVGSPAEIRRAANEIRVPLDGIRIEDPADAAFGRRCREAAADALGQTKIERGAVEALVRRPLYCAAAMVRGGAADGMVAGAVNSTPDVLRAALRVIRPAPSARTVSSFFLMQLVRPTAAGERLLIFTDCGLLPDPGPAELAEIAVRAADSFRLLCGDQPRVALLSFSTLGSADHPRVDKVRQARDRLRALAPDFPFDGELQLDAALVPDVARTKAAGSEVAGRANVLVFPDLDAGNIGYKLVERLAGARAIGPILQGLSRPANDLSRGCSVDDIVVAAAVTSLQAASVPL